MVANADACIIQASRYLPAGRARRVSSGRIDVRKNSAAWRGACRRFRHVKDFHFTERVFRPYAALRSIEPDEGWFTSKPYRGQRFSEKKWRIVEGGWTTEHCCFCSEAVDEGDTYWANRRAATILCPRCFRLFKDRIEREARTRESKRCDEPRT